MYTPDPVPNAAFGLTAADFPEEAFGVFDDNWPALACFEAVSTQWRAGSAGFTGLDYAAVTSVMDATGVRQGDRAALLGDVRVAELAVLSYWDRERRKREAMRGHG